MAHAFFPYHARWSALMLLALAGCGGTPGPDAGTGPLAWQGLVACADCDGIDTRLRLDRAPDGTGRYDLVEAFLDGGGAEYYREQGRWERTGRILTLRAATGGVRRYRLDGDGRLLAASRTGRVAGAGGALLPATDPASGL